MVDIILNISIKRGLPHKNIWQNFKINSSEQASVLSVLQQLYGKTDNSLAFRQECRIGHCGLCGMMINGHARLACKTRVTPNIKLEPLRGYEQIRDLVTDRTFLYAFAAKNELFLRPDKDFKGKPAVWQDALGSDSHHYLKCLECLCCTVECPIFINSAGAFPAPYIWVKLAQLQMNPLNKVDRSAQARKWGIEHCLDCLKCVCREGVTIKSAIKLLTK
jgi:fumarate reductase (CoM/CoB) subunit B